ncbi:MAG: NADH-quinone oxidoreductase subunit NuoE [Chloroflexi bacterium]|nr:NADH-quinone oxidoreductase subunit NuoE [Chloroflexota bacterium]
MILNEQTQKLILDEVDRYPQRRTALLPALKLAQRQLGWLSAEAIAEVADLVGVSHASANELTTFYAMLNLHPVAEQKIEVCVQLPCALRGADRLLRQLADGLGIQPGEATLDGKIELHRTHECFGSCHRAPMCRINDEYRENLSPEAARALIDELNSGRPAAEAAAQPPGKA